MDIQLVKYVFIFQTPMHQMAAQSIYGDILHNEDVLIIHNSIVAVQSGKGFTQEIIFHEIKRNQIRNEGIFYIKKILNALAYTIRRLENQYTFHDEVEIICGSDQEIFNQFLIKKIKKIKTQSKVILLDEGLGFYSITSIKDKILRLAYPILSKIFLGHSIYYIEPMGSHPSVNIVYLRHPEMLKNKRKGIKYIPFKLKTNIPSKILKKKKEILIFSFPDQDLNFKPRIKIEFLIKLIKSLNQVGFKVSIKPHPRENIDELNQLVDISPVKILDKSIAAENFSFLHYQGIIHFKSSIIFHLLDEGFPIEQIITIGFNNKKTHQIFGDNYFNMFDFDTINLKQYFKGNA